MRPNRARHARASSDRWIVSYADFITLLFAFFTAMYGISSDREQLFHFSAGLRAAFAMTPDKEAIATPPAPSGHGVLPGAPALAPVMTLDRIRESLARELRSHVDPTRVEFVTDRRGLVLSVSEAGSFEAGSDQMSSQAEAVMMSIARVMQGAPNAVRVEGHTDPTPIHTVRFTSNWELSTARATRVVAFLVEHGVAPERLSAAGYGEFHPRSSNAEPDGRMRNRRVDLVILSAGTRAAEEPARAGLP